MNYAPSLRPYKAHTLARLVAVNGKKPFQATKVRPARSCKVLCRRGRLAIDKAAKATLPQGPGPWQAVLGPLDQESFDNESEVEGAGPFLLGKQLPR